MRGGELVGCKNASAFLVLLPPCGRRSGHRARGGGEEGGDGIGAVGVVVPAATGGEVRVRRRRIVFADAFADQRITDLLGQPLLTCATRVVVASLHARGARLEVLESRVESVGEQHSSGQAEKRLQTSSSGWSNCRHMLPLAARRAALYPYTRPLFLCAGVATGSFGLRYATERATTSNAEQSPPSAVSERAVSDRAVSDRTVSQRACLIPAAAAGAVGAAMAAGGVGGFGWLSSTFERAAWAAAFAGVTAAAAADAWPELTAESSTRKSSDAMQADESRASPWRSRLLLGPSAACLLSATVAERLGGISGLGRHGEAMKLRAHTRISLFTPDLLPSSAHPRSLH